MAISTLKTYLHDGASSFRIELIGELKESDLGELAGCWQTAKSSVEGRAVVVDVTSLKAADEDAMRWILAMLSEGARILDAQEMTNAVPPRLIDPRVKLAKPSGKVSKGLRSLLEHVQRNDANGPIQAK
jgi:hypothetical protein